MLSAVAGGGLTAASLGGPLASGASAATATTATPVPNEGSSASAPAEAATGSPEGEAAQPSTSTSTTPAPTTTSEAPSTTVPSSTAPAASTPAPTGSEAPTVVLHQRKQKPSTSSPPNPNGTTTKGKGKPGKANKKATGPNNVAASPQSVAAQAGALAAMLASSEASAQALSFYRIPLFLLPIYKAAAVQYGVPWQILAAINEIETDYGTDQAVSSAGAVGWMQFMPSTWLQYGVDALNAGYADPYNPVDAVFAAARYLRAAGAAKDLRGAILAYNHSEEYADSVLLRAKLITTYPKGVIATLTGLVDGRLPVTGKHVAWHALASASLPASSATADATAVPSPAAGASGAPEASGSPAAAGTTPGSTAPPAPGAAAAAATSKSARAAKRPLQLDELITPANASVVAVQDGRIVRLGDSHELGKFVVLRDVYGDLFTYVGLGSIAPSYTPSKGPSARAKSPVVEAASKHDPAPSQPASAGTQTPVTLNVKTPPKKSDARRGQVSIQVGLEDEAPAGMDRVRLFAHPGNPDARAAAVASAARKARRTNVGQRLSLRAGSVVSSGTVLGRVSVPPGARDGHLRFAIRPAGDANTVNPGPILSNWAQLQTALHPRGAKATDALLGATASDVLLLSRTQLERTVLADPGIALAACARHEVASGHVDRRVLAVLAYLSRSGLQPTVSAFGCGQSESTAAGASTPGENVDISAINDTSISGHQGPGTITDLTIRALMTLPAEFVPHRIVSLMRYPGSSNTHADSAYASRIHLAFPTAPVNAKLDPAAATTAAHSAGSGPTAPAPLVTTSALSASQWSQLIERVAALPTPTVATKPSSSAIPDPKHR